MGKKKSARRGNGAANNTTSKEQPAQSYSYPQAQALIRPDVGTQAQFKKRKEPRTYRYDSSLSPELEWDGQNSAREKGEALLARILAAKSLEEAQTAAKELAAFQKPFLNWSGKAERLSFDCPSLPLFIHERLSTQAIIETLTGHRKRKETQNTLFDLYNDPQLSVTEQTLRAYEHPDKWSNRMVLGDSLAVMNSLLAYEHLGGQVQMIYMDPPYGVKFGSNFQPFVRKRDVSHGDDEDMTREPEMVQAYRDTWELGLHSYLTYLRDRLLLCRDLLTPSGSIFVQISDENLHHVREVMDEVFGPENFFTAIVFKKTGSEEGEGLANTADYLLWYARDKERATTWPLLRSKSPGEEGARQYVYARSDDFSEIRKMTAAEMLDPRTLPEGWKVCRRGYPLTSQDYSETRSGKFVFEGQEYYPGKNRHWSVSPEEGLPALVQKQRIYSTGNSLSGIMDLEDMPASPIGNVWADTGTGSFTDEQNYVVQTSSKVLERCILMTTQPGDLVFDPTCGSGTTSYMAEWWGRRWITADVSRVPLALARQRILSATFPYYKLKDAERGPAGGFDYQPKELSKNKRVDGYGIAHQHTLSSIAGEESPRPIVMRENPELDYSVTRVSGTFCFEATIPQASDLDIEARSVRGEGTFQSHVERMIEILRKSPLLRLDGGKTVLLKNIRPPAKSLSLSAEAQVDATATGQKTTLEDAVLDAVEDNKGLLKFSGKPVAIVIGPENGPVSSRLVEHAAREAAGKSYSHLYVIGFAIEAKAREAIEHCETVFDIPATYVQATPDLLMGDLLKNMRSSQIFSVCGLPEVKVSRQKAVGSKQKGDEEVRYQVELLGLDVFDPVTMENQSRTGNDVPAWFLDTDYNGLCFHVSQAFFPRTSAWDNLKKALKGQFDETVWDHLAGTISAPFEPGEHKTIAVKVIDDRGNELLVVKELKGK